MRLDVGGAVPTGDLERLVTTGKIAARSRLQRFHRTSRHNARICTTTKSFQA